MSFKRTFAVNLVFQEKFADSRTMTKKRRNTKKSQDNLPHASEQQCSEPGNNSVSSGPVNNSMSEGELGKAREEKSGVNKNKENIIATSDVLRTDVDERNVDGINLKTEPAESNLEDLIKVRNNCSALKSNLNAEKKKYEEEKKKTQKLFEENQDLKSKVSSLERELQDVKMQLQKFQKEVCHHQKSSEENDQMEVEPSEDNVCEQKELGASIDFTSEKIEDTVQNNAQGTAKGNDQDKDVNWYDMDEKEWDNAGAAGHAGTKAWRSSQPSNQSSVPAPSGPAKGYDQHKDVNRYRMDEKQWDEEGAAGHAGGSLPWQKKRESGQGQIRNEWHQRQPNRNENQPPRRNEEQHYDLHYAHNWGRGRGLNNKGDHGQNYRREMGDRGNHGQNYNCIANNQERCDQGMRTTDESLVVTEILGDLFTAPADCALAHCVAEDMRMGSGIAVTFRQKFRCVDELLQQRKRQGNVAVLEHEGRYIYYLVTKRESNGKPTMDTLRRSLEAMREHVVQNQVKKIAMPRIGCGLDRLEWKEVRPVIEKIFSGTGAQITIYNYREDMAESSKPKPNSNVRFKTAEKPVVEIEPETAILCLCAADGSIDSTLKSLDKKFRIITEYQKMDRKLGNILSISKPNYLIILLIVKEKNVSQLSFVELGKCVRQACKLIDKEKYYYVAVESFDDKNEPFLFERVITVIKNYLDSKWEKELWLCYPNSRKYEAKST